MPPRRRSAAYWFVLVLARPVLRLIARTEWRGVSNLPVEGGFLACPNHVTYLDPFTVGHFLVNNGCPPRYLGKEAVFRVPILGRIIRSCGQIPVYRETAAAGKAFAGAVAAVNAGECVGIYPEATLTRDPDLWPMVGKTGAARVALETGCPVIPIAHWGDQEILPRYSSAFHPFPRKTVTVVAGPPVDLSRFVGRPLDAVTLREATDAILDDITALLADLRGEPVPIRRWDPRQHGQTRIGKFIEDSKGEQE
jgi:1-acyl-sn-glycerol-3-phosphate acyltransferase